jgi:hypothetical protein
MKRFVMTVVALISVMSLSSSVAIAAPSSQAKSATTNAGGCGTAAGLEVSAVKPEKKSHENRGKHLGQNKHAEQPAEENESEGVDEQGGDRPQNHGWFVSQAAHDESFAGRDHGKHVSEVARSDAGKP